MNKIKTATLCLIIIQVFIFYNKAFSTVGQGMFFAFNVSLVALLIFCFLLAYFQWWRFRFPIIFAIIELINGIYHLVWTTVLGKYFPSVVSGLFFIPFNIYIIRNYKLLFQQVKTADRASHGS